MDFTPGSRVRLTDGSVLVAPWHLIRELPLVILVGVTGVGKSTTLAAVATGGVELSLLPDRRALADAVIVEPLAGGPVQDREQRFALTAQYRAAHPGGLAEALGALVVNREAMPGLLVFDGLRGREEVEYAAQAYELARFVVLDAPDPVRVRRLLGRADGFDQVAATASSGALLARLEGIEGIQVVFGPAERRSLAALEHRGLDPEDVLAKTRIVVAERRHYDPATARALLAGLAPGRVLALDTAALGPAEVAARLVDWL